MDDAFFRGALEAAINFANLSPELYEKFGSKIYPNTLHAIRALISATCNHFNMSGIKKPDSTFEIKTHWNHI